MMWPRMHHLIFSHFNFPSVVSQAKSRASEKIQLRNVKNQCAEDQPAFKWTECLGLPLEECSYAIPDLSVSKFPLSLKLHLSQLQ